MFNFSDVVYDFFKYDIIFFISAESVTYYKYFTTTTTRPIGNCT